MPTLHPVILSGGSGTRLWPLSRESLPKQFLPLGTGPSLLADTLGRLPRLAGVAPPLVVCSEEHRFLVAETLRQTGVRGGRILLEPVGRNTAPAIAVAALTVEAADPDGFVLVLPSDHVVTDAEAFAQAVATAVAAARTGALVTFGIDARTPETGYGYIRRGRLLDGVPGAHRVDRFVEKPDLETARSYLADGTWSWNSGMFVFPVGHLLAELSDHAPAVLHAARAAVERSRPDLDFIRLDTSAFADAPAIAIDTAVMERTRHAVVVPCDIGWSDVGSWSALWDLATAADSGRDGLGNAVKGDVQLLDAAGCYVRSEGPLVAAIGVQDLVIVATDDAVLVSHKDRVQQVKDIVQKLKGDGRLEASSHRIVHRPWGWYQTVDAGPRFQVKRICVKPGARLSLQRHAHRAEHWVVVRGVARVTRDEDILTLRPNMSTYIPLGAAHRLENPGTDPLELIEVQSGGYLGEDDIERLSDDYGRGTG